MGPLPQFIYKSTQTTKHWQCDLTSRSVSSSSGNILSKNSKHTSQCGRGALRQNVASETLKAAVQMDNHTSFPFISLSPRRSWERGFAAPHRCHGNTVCISQWAIPELLPLDWNSDSPLSAEQPAKAIVYLWPLTERHYGCASVKSETKRDGEKQNSLRTEVGLNYTLIRCNAVCWKRRSENKPQASCMVRFVVHMARSSILCGITGLYWSRLALSDRTSSHKEPFQSDLDWAPPWAPQQPVERNPLQSASSEW